MADEEVVLQLLDLAKKKKHDQVKSRLATVNKETQRLFKERYRIAREQRKEPTSPRSSNNNVSSSTSSSSTVDSSTSLGSGQRSSRARNKGVMLQSWEPAESGSRLVLRENDVVDIVSFQSSEWCRVQFGRTKGAVPTSYLKVLPSQGKNVVALYDFVSDKPGHLPFRRDDHLTAFEQIEGWMRGIKGSRFGRWPVTYVRELTAEEEEEQVLLMGMQADSRKDKDHQHRDRRSKALRSVVDQHKTRTSSNSDSHSDSDDDGKTLDTAIFRPDSGGPDSDERAKFIKKTVSMPAMGKVPPPPPPTTIAAPSLPPPPLKPAPATVTVDALNAALNDDSADLSKLPASVADSITKLKSKRSDISRKSAELHELESALRAKSESQEAHGDQQRLRVRALESRAAQLDEREAALNERESKLNQRDAMLSAREEALKVASEALRQRTKEAAAAAPAATDLSAPPVAPPPGILPPPGSVPPPPALVALPARASFSVPPPPVPEEDSAFDAPPPLPAEPTAPDTPMSLPTHGVQPTVPLEQYLGLREAQGWSVQPPLPCDCDSETARELHDAAGTALYGDAKSSDEQDRTELVSSLDALLGSLGSSMVERVRDAALCVVPLGAAFGRDREDVLRAVRCLIENVIAVIIYGEKVNEDNENADANMSYATSSTNSIDMMDRLRLMLGFAGAQARLKLNVSERAVSARRQSFAVVMKTLQEEPEDDDEDTDGESEFEKYANSTDVGRFFRSIIEKHGVRFPAVQQELTAKLPILVKEANITTVQQLVALDQDQLKQFKFTPQMITFVQQLAKKYLAK